MNFQNMKYFISVAEEQSFSGAARKLFISQQALSDHIRKLEEEVGAPLFKRGTKLTLTPAGERFMIGCKNILSAKERMLADISAVSAVHRSRITVAVPTYGMPPYFPQIVKNYREKYPEYEVKVVKRLHSDIAHNMNGVDLYLSWLPLSDDLEHVYIIPEDRRTVVAAEAALTAHYGDEWPIIKGRLLQSGDLSLISDFPFILLKDRNDHRSQDIWYTFSWYGIQPPTAFESELVELNAEMCAAGAGAMLCTETLADWLFPNDKYPGMFVCPINTPNLKCALAYSYAKRNRLNPAELAFIDETKNVLAL